MNCPYLMPKPALPSVQSAPSKRILGAQIWSDGSRCRYKRRVSKRVTAALLISGLFIAGVGDSTRALTVDTASSSASPHSAYAASLPFTSEPSTVSVGAQAPTGTLRYSVLTPPTNLDPDLQAPGLQGMLWTAPLYDTLTYLEADYSVSPLLATGWEVGSDSDGPYVDFELREGLAFPDGTPFNADTVAARIQRAQTLPGSLTAADVRDVTVEALSASQVRLRGPNAVALPRLLAGPAGMMISQNAVTSGADLTEEPAGIGMFNLTEYSPQGVTYSAAPNYWDSEHVHIGHLEIVTNSDDNARLNLLRTGDVDLTYLNPALDSAVQGIEHQPVSGALAVTYGFAINTSIAPFDDIRVRRAMAMAIDRDAICTAVLFSECELNFQLYPTNVIGHNPDIDEASIPFDVAAATNLINEAGAQGARFTVYNYANIAKFAALTTAVQAQWEAIGLNPEVVDIPPAQITTEFGLNHTAPVTFVAYGAFGDPSQPIPTYLLPDSIYNPGGFDDPEITRLAAEALADPVDASRASLYEQISARTTVDLVHIPVLTPVLTYWVSPRIHGFEAPITNANPLWRGVSVDD